MPAVVVRFIKRFWSERDRVWVWGLGPLSYLALAIIVTWPLAQTANTDLLVGTEPANTVAQFNAWTIWWNADRALHGFVGYWESPIFYPARNTFAFSEPQPATLLVAPVLWLTGSRALAMNVYLWLSLALNGWFTERLLRSTSTASWIAIGAGAAMLFLPLVHWQIGVIQLVPMWGTIWLWWAFLRFANQDRKVTSWRASMLVGAEIGLAMTASWYCCVHHGLSLALLMIIGGWVLGRKLISIQYLASIGLSILVFVILCGPILWHLGMMANNEDFKRDQDTVAALSVFPGDYLSLYGRTLFGFDNPYGRPGWLMSPGNGKLLLAPLGLILGFFAGRTLTTGFLALLAITAFFLSLGDNLQILQWKPWWFLVEYVPGFEQVRNVFRFGYFFQAATVLLASIAIDVMWKSVSASSSLNNNRLKLVSPGSRSLALKLVIILVALYTWLDPWPPRPGMTALSYSTSRPEWIEILKTQQKSHPGAALCLPMASGNGVKDYEITTRWMMAGTYHGVPLANGYSGFFPERYFFRRSQIRSSGMDADLLRQLIVDGVSWVVIDRRLYNTWWGNQQQIGLVNVSRTFGDGSEVDLYKLELAPVSP